MKVSLMEISDWKFVDELDLTDRSTCRVKKALSPQLFDEITRIENSKEFLNSRIEEEIQILLHTTPEILSNI